MTKMKKCCAKKGYICDLSGESIVRGDGYYKIILSDGRIDNKQKFKIFRIKASVFNQLDEEKRRYVYVYINDKKAIRRFFNDRKERKAFMSYVKAKMSERLEFYKKSVSLYSGMVEDLENRLKEL